MTENNGPILLTKDVRGADADGSIEAANLTAYYGWRVEAKDTKGKGAGMSRLVPARFRSAGDIDVDVFAIAFDGDKNPIAAAHRTNKDAFGDGTMVYPEDVKAKPGQDAREGVRMRLAQVHHQVRWIGFGMVVPEGASFRRLANSRVFVVPSAAEDQLLIDKFRSIQDGPRAAWLASFARMPGGRWKVWQIDGRYDITGADWRNLSDAAIRDVCVDPA